MAAGEVLLNGSPLGTAGTSGTSLANLFDGNNLTQYTAFPTTQPWMGIDAGGACTLTRLRLSTNGGAEDLPTGAVIQGSITSTFPSPSFVQGNYNCKNSSGSISCPFTSNNTAGNCLVVFLQSNGSNISISDINGTYTPITTDGSALHAYVFPNCKAGANTVTANITGGTFVQLHIMEYNGVVTSNPVDVFNSATGGPATSMNLSLTTLNPTDVAIMCVAAGGSDNMAAFSGYTIRTSYNSGHASGAVADNSATMDLVLTSAGTTDPSASWTTSSNYEAIVIALMANTAPTALFTIANRCFAGTLLNEYLISSAAQFRYYRFLSAAGSYGSVADLDFIAGWTPGVTAQCCTPTITPPGGDYDEPIVVRLASITTDAKMYYTLDGSTPTTSSTLYTGAFTISSNCTLSVIGVSPGVSNSRVVQTVFHVPSAFVSTDVMYDNRNYPIGFQCVDPTIFYDPIGGYWYMYGINFDEPGVITHGFIGINIYRSADVRNWTYVNTSFAPAAGTEDGSHNTTFYYTRVGMMYNAAHNNYVCWISGSNVPVLTSSTPYGPFTTVATYTTLAGFQIQGGMCHFIDPNDGLGGITAYVIKEVGSSDSTLLIARLTSDYTNIDGVNYVTYSNSGTSPFGQKSEGFSMCYNNGYYYWMASGYTQWQPNTNLVVSNTTGPLGTWSASFNPFANVSVPQTSQEASYGVTPSYTNAYDSQNVQKVLQIPGRNAYIYLGDRYGTGLNSTTPTSTTANFYDYRRLTLPITFPTPGVSAITWNDNWSLDSVFPNVSGAPLAASNLTIIGYNATWVNNEPKPANIYFDMAIDPAFTVSVTSEVLTPGAASFTLSAFPANYFRVRTVNANGTSLSNVVQNINPPSFPCLLPFPQGNELLLLQS